MTAYRSGHDRRAIAARRDVQIAVVAQAERVDHGHDVRGVGRLDCDRRRWMASGLEYGPFDLA